MQYKRKPDGLLDGRLFSYHFAFVVQFALAYVGAVTHVHLSGCAVFAQRDRFCFIVGPSFRTALLGVPALGIWHIALF
jgi:hypothetical protein